MPVAKVKFPAHSFHSVSKVPCTMFVLYCNCRIYSSRHSCWDAYFPFDLEYLHWDVLFFMGEW